MGSVELSDIEDRSERDFRRANGAPMVKRQDGSGKWERYSRPSGWGETLEDRSNLETWRLNRAIEGVAASPALAAEIAANVGISEGAAQRRERAIQIGRGEEAADLGTALHKMTERVERGEEFKAPPPYDADIAAYLSALDEAGLTSEYIECKICSDEWRAAGTADRIYLLNKDLLMPDGTVLPAGSRVIGDLKTGNRLDYSLPGYTIQLALYCDGVFYDVNTDERTPLPANLNTRWGLLVHLPAGSAHCELLWCDLAAGRDGARTVQAVRAWRKRTDFSGVFTYPPSDESAVLFQMIETVNVDAQSMSSLSDDEWLDAMLPFCQERINIIGTYSNEARNILLRKWPEGVPTIRQGGITAPQLARVLDFLDAVESAFEIPWPTGDPRELWNLGKHRSEMDRATRNQAPSSKETQQP